MAPAFVRHRAFHLALVIGMLFQFSALAANAGDGGKYLFILSGQSNMENLDPEVSFIPAVSKEFGKDNVIVVKEAKSGQPIRRWFKGWKPSNKQEAKEIGDLYDQLISSVRSAIKDQRIDAVVFIWVQGERDAREGNGEVYAACLKGLYEQLSADLNRKDIYWVIARLSDFDMKNAKYPDWTKIREVQMAVAEGHPRAAWVNADDLNGPQNKLHYSRDGYGVFGRRLAEKAIQLIKHNRTPEADTVQ